MDGDVVNVLFATISEGPFAGRWLLSISDDLTAAFCHEKNGIVTTHTSRLEMTGELIPMSGRVFKGRPYEFQWELDGKTWRRTCYWVRVIGPGKEIHGVDYADTMCVDDGRLVLYVQA